MYYIYYKTSSHIYFLKKKLREPHGPPASGMKRLQTREVAGRASVHGRCLCLGLYRFSWITTYNNWVTGVMKYHKTILTYIDLWTWRGSCYCTMSLRGTSLTCTHQNDSLAPTFMYTYLHVHRQPVRLGLGDLGTWGLGDLGTWGQGDKGTRRQGVGIKVYINSHFKLRRDSRSHGSKERRMGNQHRSVSSLSRVWGREEEEEEEEEREQQQNISMIYYNILYIRNIILIHV